MKTLTLILTLAVISLSVSGQSFLNQSTSHIKEIMFWDIGTSNLIKPVIGAYYGLEIKRDDKLWYPFAAAGIRTHFLAGDARRAIGYGSIETGEQFVKEKYELIGSIGMAYGGSKDKQDTHVACDTVEYYSKGSTSDHFIQPVLTIRAIYHLGDVPVYGHITYTDKVLFAGIGIKITIGE